MLEEYEYPAAVEAVPDLAEIHSRTDAVAETLMTDIDDAYNNEIISTSDAIEIAVKEDILKLNPSVKDTLDDRRERVRTLWHDAPPYTRYYLKRLMDRNVDATKYTMVIDNINQAITFTLRMSSSVLIPVITRLIEDIIPLQMTITFTIAYNYWSQYSAKTWTEVSTLTWDEMKNRD